MAIRRRDDFPDKVGGCSRSKGEISVNRCKDQASTLSASACGNMPFALQHHVLSTHCLWQLLVQGRFRKANSACNTNFHEVVPRRVVALPQLERAVKVTKVNSKWEFGFYSHFTYIIYLSLPVLHRLSIVTALREHHPLSLVTTHTTPQTFTKNAKTQVCCCVTQTN